jgi:Ca-activated chloride channel homolog
MIRLANWYFLILIPFILFIMLRKKRKATIKFSSVQLLKNSGMKKTWKHKVGIYLIVLSVILLDIAWARPQMPVKAAPIKQEGIDIAMILDISGSMGSVDFKPNRLEVARSTMADFIKERASDRMSLIIFAGTAYTRVPLTLDHDILTESLQKVTSESVDEDGTAIGMALSVGMNRLKKSDAASKIMILVTDGDNNAGTINPNTAADMAKDLNIKVYTIGVGTDKTIMPVQVFGQTQYQQVDGGLNEDLLKSIADTTGGKYFRAKDAKALSGIFADINQLEKTEYNKDNRQQYEELAFPLMKGALILLLMGIFFDRYCFVRIP